MRPIISIGLDPHVVEAISERVDGRIIDYQYLPDMYSVHGQVYVQSQSGFRYIKPRGVLYYCYFENPGNSRRALALSDVSTFPYVRQTILHDDKALSLIAARNVDPGPDVPRGFTGSELPISINERVVGKWGQWHCGDGKEVFDNQINVPEPAILEPFISGESHRILVVNHGCWQIKYESDDWRKNVNSTISVLDNPDPRLVERALKIANGLNLRVCGIDFIVNDEGAYLLEVNAYPGLDQVPEAEKRFIDMAIAWAGTLVKE